MKLSCPHCNGEFESTASSIEWCPFCGYSEELDGDGEQFYGDSPIDYDMEESDD